MIFYKALKIKELEDLHLKGDVGAIIELGRRNIEGTGRICGEQIKVNSKKGFDLFIEAYNLDEDNDIINFHLAECYMRGIGTEIDFDKALDLFEKSGNASMGTYFIASFLALGVGKRPNHKKAFALFKRLNDASYDRLDAPTNDKLRGFIDYKYDIELGDCYYYGLGVDQDIKAAINYYQVGLKDMISSLCFTAKSAERYKCEEELPKLEKSFNQFNDYLVEFNKKYSGSLLNNIKRRHISQIQKASFNECEEYAKRGFLEAIIKLAYLYAFGIGTVEKDKKSESLSLKAMNKGSYISAFKVGGYHTRGSNFCYDPDLSAKCYFKGVKLLVKHILRIYENHGQMKSLSYKRMRKEFRLLKLYAENFIKMFEEVGTNLNYLNKKKSC